MTYPVIETNNLRRLFEERPAVNGLNLQVNPGSIFGFLGRNGAGKTTTIRLILGFLKATAGDVRLFGQPVTGPGTHPAMRRRIGYVSENKHLYPYMTVEQIIRFTRPFFPRWRPDLERRYLDLFDLPPRRKISALSRGMRTGLNLLLAMSHNAELLILDEPTEGLDPVMIDAVLRELVALNASEATTIFFSSHQLTEVERIADHIAIVNRGRTVVSGSLDDLKIQYQRLQIVLPHERSVISWIESPEHIRQEGRTVSILTSRNIDGLIEQARSLPGTSVERFPVSLKDLFVEHVSTN